MIDSHCHIDFSDFDTDRAQVWQRCLDVGVRGLIIPGVAPNQWCDAQKLCTDATTSGFGFTVGLHPWWLCSHFMARQALSHEQILAQLESTLHQHAGATHCVAIGECGLDTLKLPLELGLSKEEALALQCAVLRVHIDVANERGLPLIIHAVKAHQALLSQLDAHAVHAGGVIHGFSGSVELATRYWQLGFRIGVGGSITYPRAEKTQRAIQALPIDALLLETDAPSMPLHGGQGKRNSPEYLPRVLDALAVLRQEDRDTLISNTTQNTMSVFPRLKLAI